MSKIICIGELSLNMVLGSAGEPLGTLAGSRVANAAAILAKEGFEVLMASEAAADPVGDIVVADLAKAGVDTHYIDRYTEGRTPMNVFVANGLGSTGAVTRYELYPSQCFDIVWPKVEEDDIVLLGGYYAIDPRMRHNMSQFLAHVYEKGARIVYMPGYLPQLEPRITRVMPQILENLEMASMVIARESDLALIFGTDSAEECFRNKIEFYAPTLLVSEEANKTLSLYNASGHYTAPIDPAQCNSLLWNAGIAAGATAAIAGGCELKVELPGQSARAILDKALEVAVKASAETKFPQLGL